MPETFIFLPFLCLFFTFLSIKTNCTPLSAYCTTSMCGDTEIRYPFWLQTTTTIQPCGYPGLGIVCTSSNTSIISVSKQYFPVKSIDYSNYTATLNASGFGRGMNYEFLLVWRASMECSKCEMSYGRCGYNNTSDFFLCFCEDGTITNNDCKGARKDHRFRKLKIEVVVPVMTISTCLIILYCIYMKHSNAACVLFQPPRISNDDQKLEVVIKQFGSNIPRRYTYSDITKMTNSFHDKIGEGGNGNVYKGFLFDGHPIAVKILRNNKFSGEQFLTEITSTSTTSHANVVSLLGFCLDGNKRALIYEYMPNGSLEKHIHQESNSLLGIDQLYKIAIGVARGLDYLHSKHHTCMAHLDIKPHNILLDEDFCPKISDFGLAIFCNNRESILSKLQARGTIGYIAPELFDSNVGTVSLSTDVYSFGMMVLEMVGARNNPTTTTTTGNHSEAYFPDWVYKRVTRHTNQDLQADDINAIERKMILVGLWCIQINPLHRPTIEKVIEMLEGSIEWLEIPPKPEFHCITAFGRASLITTSSVSNTMLSSSIRSAEDSSQEHKVAVTTSYSGSYSCDVTLPR